MMTKDDWHSQKNLLDRDWLIEKHKPLVIHLAKKISDSLPFGIDLEDLIAYGQVGLVEAGESFDASRGIAFATFAHYRVKGAIYDGLRSMGIITRSRVFRFEAYADDALFNQASDGTATGAAIDDDLKNIGEMVDDLIPIYLLSLEDANLDTVEDQTSFGNPDFETDDLLRRVRDSLAELAPEDGDLLKKIYFENVSMKDIAAQNGVNKSWISRLHARAIKHLQRVLIRKGILKTG